MGVSIYLHGREGSLYFRDGRRVAYTSRKVNVLRYSKQAARPEQWLVVYDADSGGTELGRFKSDDLYGYAIDRALPDSEP